MNMRGIIDRPVTAAVLSLVIVLAGLVSLPLLPVSLYPDIVPPQVSVTASFPGADAETVAQSVAVPLEQAINGADGMIYLQSLNSDGKMQLSIYFNTGTDPDIDAINVSNRVQGVLSSLPQDVQRLGVTVQKQYNAPIAIVVLTAASDRHDDVAVSNYAVRNVVDELRRLPGIGDAQLFGQKDYAMRIWLQPDKLAQFRLTATDVATALADQNKEFATGSIAGTPGETGVFTYGMTVRGRLPDLPAFGNVILRAMPDGSALRLRDVAHIELGSEHYDFNAIQNGQKAVLIGLYLKPGANALAAVASVRARMTELAREFPDGIGYSLPYDTTHFVRASMVEVLKTFTLALVLVAGITLLFLQSLRAAVIPLLAVPVSIVGSFAGLYAFGFSINLFTLFGLILAIGIVVDDAIVVLENVERLMRERHLSSRQAAIQAMDEVRGPVIAIVLILCAVFVPVAFLGGLSGELYRQFAATIVISVVISGLVALTLTPALCAALLRPRHVAPPPPLRVFNQGFAAANRASVGLARVLVNRRWLTALCLTVICEACVVLAERVPSGLVPAEDQADMLIGWSLSPGAALSRTTEVMVKADKILRGLKVVRSATMFAGLDLLSSAPRTYAGLGFLTLTDWSDRTRPEDDTPHLVGAIRRALSRLREADFFVFNPPPISGLGEVDGFEFHLLDREGRGTVALNATTERFIADAAERPELSELSASLRTDTPRYQVEVDRNRAKVLGISISSIFDAVRSTFGSLYVNDFALYGRNYHVNLQSDAAYRHDPADIRQVFVRTDGGEMVPLSTVLTLKRVVGADAIEHFDVYPSTEVTGSAAPDYSSGQAIAAIEALARDKLPPGYGLAWAGQAFQEKSVGNHTWQAAGFGIVMVFLILAALYERWALPVTVLMVVPLALFGAFLSVWLRGMNNDIYFQVGLVTLIGLSAKNAVLIVEFAARRQREGMSAAGAALAALRVRFRPVVMTSLAFILGCLPLAFSVGAGAGARRSLGTGVVGGMLGATVLALFLIPALYRIIAAPRREASWPRVEEGRAELAGDPLVLPEEARETLL
jgi:hydrophobe/amphiphile efflux-1 (HAE1) family protein